MFQLNQRQKNRIRVGMLLLILWGVFVVGTKDYSDLQYVSILLLIILLIAASIVLVQGERQPKRKWPWRKITIISTIVFIGLTGATISIISYLDSLSQKVAAIKIAKGHKMYDRKVYQGGSRFETKWSDAGSLLNDYIQTRKGLFHIKGWNALQVDANQFLVSLTIEDAKRRGGWYFEVNTKSRFCRYLNLDTAQLAYYKRKYNLNPLETKGELFRRFDKLSLTGKHTMDLIFYERFNRSPFRPNDSIIIIEALSRHGLGLIPPEKVIDFKKELLTYSKADLLSQQSTLKDKYEDPSRKQTADEFLYGKKRGVKLSFEKEGESKESITDYEKYLDATKDDK